MVPSPVVDRPHAYVIASQISPGLDLYMFLKFWLELINCTLLELLIFKKCIFIIEGIADVTPLFTH